MLSLYSNNLIVTMEIEEVTLQYIKSEKVFDRNMCLNLAEYEFTMNYSDSVVQNKYYINSIDWIYNINEDNLTPINIYCDFEIFNKKRQVPLIYKYCNIIINTINFYDIDNKYILTDKAARYFMNIDLSMIKKNNNVYVEVITSDFLKQLKRLNINLKYNKDKIYIHYNTVMNSLEDLKVACEVFNDIITLDKIINFINSKIRVFICIESHFVNTVICILNELKNNMDSLYYSVDFCFRIEDCVEKDILVSLIRELKFNKL